MAEHWSIDGPKVVEVGGPDEPPRELVVRTLAGRVDVVAHDDLDSITVEVSSVRGRPIDVDWDGATLRVEHPKLQWESWLDGLFSGGLKGLKDLGRSMDSVEISIAVPRSVTVTLGTVSADGLVSGTHAPARVKTVSGTVVVDGVTGHLDARTVSGEIDVRNQRGPLTGQSVSGSLTVHAAELGDLRATSVSGSLSVDLEQAPATLFAKSVSGDVVVRIPHGSGYELSAKSVSGRVTAGHEEVARRPGKVEGVLRGTGEGRVEITATTVSGDVTVLHAHPAPPREDATQPVPSTDSTQPLGGPDLGKHL